VGDQALRFRHPLARAAIYQAAAISARQAANLALAAVHADDPDRSVSRAELGSVLSGRGRIRVI
jgi:hypothetical protein